MSAAILANALEIDLNLEARPETYTHVYPWVRLWKRRPQTNIVPMVGNHNWLEKHLTTLKFDIMEGGSPLVVGPDITRYSKKIHLANDPHIIIRRPADFQSLTYRTYIAANTPESPFKLRSKIGIAPRQRSAVRSLMSDIRTQSSYAPRVFAKA